MKKVISYLTVYLNDSSVRLNVGILLGLFLTSFYVVFNLILGIKHENVWFVTVAVYYMLVTLLRYFLIDGGTESEKSENREGLLGSLMLILTAPMTGMIIYTVITGSARSYPSSTLPVFSIYAIFSIFRATHGILSSHKNKEKSAHRTLHLIRLSIALTSLFNLQTSLFAFLEINTPLTIALNFILGGAVSLSMLLVARQSKVYPKRK